MSIAIFVPVFNDERTVGKILSQIPDKIGHLKTTLFIVDDGSSDNSLKIAKKFTDNILIHSENRGVGAATKTGLMEIRKHSNFNYIVKFDADGQHDPLMIKDVINELEKKADIVICSRFHFNSDKSHAFLDRLLLNSSAASWVNNVTGWNISDARSGFMGFKANILNTIVHEIITERYGIPIELLLRIFNLNPDISICEIPHPAMYDGNISDKLRRKYSTEEINEKVDRMKVAYQAFLNVLDSIGVDLNNHRSMKIA